VSRTTSITRVRVCLATRPGQGRGLLALGTNLSDDGRHVTFDLVGSAIGKWRPEAVEEALVLLTFIIELNQSPQILIRDEGGHWLPILLNDNPRPLPGKLVNEA